MIEEKDHIGGAPITALSANKTQVRGQQDAAHVDGKDLEFGLTTMCVFSNRKFWGCISMFPKIWDCN